MPRRSRVPRMGGRRPAPGVPPMRTVRCPTCLIEYPTDLADAEGKFVCRVCGQKLRLPPPPANANRTVLAQWGETEAAPAEPPQRVRRATEPPPVRRERDDRESRDDREYREEDGRPSRRRRRYSEDDHEAPRARHYEDDYDDRPRRRGRYCRSCDCRVQVRRRQRISTTGWTLICVGILFWPLIIAGIFMKEDVERCDECGMILHVGARDWFI